MNKLDEMVCSLIKKRLKSMGISYKSLGDYLEISEVSVKRLLNLNQPISMKRLIDITFLLQEPLSTIIAEAEKLVDTVPNFNIEQDNTFCEQPELYTIFAEICRNLKAAELMAKFNLGEPSLYLYLRKLEEINLIEITAGLHFRLLVPKHICFSDSNRFPVYFKNQVIDGLKERVQIINSDDVYFITAKLRLTDDEFKQYNLKLEELMQKSLKLTLSRDETTIKTSEYTIVDMGAKGRFHPEPKQPKNNLYNE